MAGAGLRTVRRVSECQQCPTDQVGGGSPTAPDLAVGEVPAGAGGGDAARSGSRRSDPDLVQAVAAFVDELVDEAADGGVRDEGVAPPAAGRPTPGDTDGDEP